MDLLHVDFCLVARFQKQSQMEYVPSNDNIRSTRNWIKTTLTDLDVVPVLVENSSKIAQGVDSCGLRLAARLQTQKRPYYVRSDDNVRYMRHFPRNEYEGSMFRCLWATSLKSKPGFDVCGPFAGCETSIQRPT
jgi:hypothetical protein